MKLTLTQVEIEEALKQYVFSTISIKDGTDIKIDFTAGRGEKGLTAEIDINYLGLQSIALDRPAVAPAQGILRTSEEQEPVEETQVTQADEVPANTAGLSIFQRQ